MWHFPDILSCFSFIFVVSFKSQLKLAMNRMSSPSQFKRTANQVNEGSSHLSVQNHKSPNSKVLFVVTAKISTNLEKGKYSSQFVGILYHFFCQFYAMQIIQNSIFNLVHRYVFDDMIKNAISWKSWYILMKSNQS